jgi:hypothetical protein
VSSSLWLLSLSSSTVVVVVVVVINHSCVPP